MSTQSPTLRSFPSLFPKASRDKVMTLIELGNTLKTACKHERLNFAMLKQFFTLVESVMSEPSFHPDDYSDAENEIISFFQDIQAALARSETNLVAKVKSAADKDWKAAQWQLQQRNPDEWANQAKPVHTSVSVQVAQQDNQSLLSNPNLDLRRLTSSELQLLEELITKASTPAPTAIEVPPQPRQLEGS